MIALASWLFLAVFQSVPPMKALPGASPFAPAPLRPGGPSVLPLHERNTTENVRPQIAAALALDPQDPARLVAATTDYRSSNAPGIGVAYSFDGGSSWTARRLDQVNPAAVKYEGQGIAVLAAGGQGAFFCAYTDLDQNLVRNRLCVARSSDAGLTWPTIAVVADHAGTSNQPFEDKSSLAVDTTGGPFDSQVYLATSFIPEFTPSEIRFCRSTDGGQSFSSRTTISTLTNCTFPSVDVGPNGEVYVAWRRIGTIQLDVSLNGGVTFGLDRQAAILHPLPSPLPNASFRVQSAPSLAVARRGPQAGALYLAWPDAQGPLGSPDVVFSRSTDGGATWSAPIRVSDDTNGAFQWFPAVAVAPDGTITVAFYDRRQFPNSNRYDIYLAQSRDGGLTFGPNVRVNSETSHAIHDGFGGTFIGDYMGLAVTNRFQYPLWTDCRPSNGNSEGFTLTRRWSR